MLRNVRCSRKRVSSVVTELVHPSLFLRGAAETLKHPGEGDRAGVLQEYHLSKRGVIAPLGLHHRIVNIARSGQRPAPRAGIRPPDPHGHASGRRDSIHAIAREDCRRLMLSAWYQRLFPTRLVAPRPAVHDLRTTVGGGRFAPV